MKSRMLALLSLLLISFPLFAQIEPEAVPDLHIETTSNGAEPSSDGSFRVYFTGGTRPQICNFTYTVAGSADPGATEDGTADYLTLSGGVTITSGGTEATIDVEVFDDFNVEGTQSVIVTLNTPGNATNCPGVKLGTSSATVNIADNDANLTVIKSVVGGTASASDWTMNVTNAIPSDPSFPGAESPGTDIVIAAGAYSVSESGGPVNYTASPSAGCSGTAVAGQSYSCTITNTFVPPTTTTTTTTTAVPTTTTTATPTTTTTATPTTTTTATPTTTTTATPTTTTTAAPTTTTTAGSTTTTTAGSTTTTTAGSTTTTTAGPTTTTTEGSTTTTAEPTTTTTAVATTTTTTTTTSTTTTTLPPGTPQLTLVKTADPSTFDKVGMTINYSYLVTSTGTAAVLGPITVTDSRMLVACPPVASLEIGQSVTCTSSLETLQADVILGYILTSSVAAGSNASTEAVETNVPFATVGIPTLSEWSMIMLSFLFLLMGVGYLRKRKMI